MNNTTIDDTVSNYVNQSNLSVDNVFKTYMDDSISPTIFFDGIDYFLENVNSMLEQTAYLDEFILVIGVVAVSYLCYRKWYLK